MADARRLIVNLILIAGTCLAASPGLADTAAEFRDETRRLDEAIERYGSVRDDELEAIRELDELWQLLEQRSQDPDVSVAELRELDAAADQARVRACELSARSSELRTALYDHMESLEALARELDAGREPAVRTSPHGLWRYEASPNDVHGLLELRIEGSLVTGQYRSSNGNHGSVRGTWSRGRLRLDRVDADLGPAGQVTGRLDKEQGRLVGRWTAQVLSNGEPAAGTWVAFPVEEGAP